MSEKLRIIGAPDKEFYAEITSTIRHEKNGDVVCKDARIKVETDSFIFFSPMKMGQVVTFIREDDTFLELYKSIDNSEEFLFSTHPYG
ncbi:hypothetical protein [Kosakonia oryzae]|uniref:Uncharacterized protein n=1 Tax=Kosakonia oryzae TaxID=497725 RepID=A0AA94KPN0_9ENTR|nr:hypothetical protein [Kosakonia oryzae]ANI83311.1 hypothetical protein AWR26_14525 [Kosakonia oryzae]SFC02827.1 hypothetical protein SAMN05216286_1349 [Kosakonia oryzae]